MPKINVYLPDDLAEAVRKASIPVSAVCQQALGEALRNVTSVQEVSRDPGRYGRTGGRFTDRARKAVDLAFEQAAQRGHNFVGTEHLLLGMADEGTNLALKVLGALDIEVADLRSELEGVIAGALGDMPPVTQGEPALTPRAKKVFELAAQEAGRLGHNYVGCEHLLLGLVAEAEGIGGRVLRSLGAELTVTRRAVVTALTGFLQARQLGSTASSPSSPPDPLLGAILARLEAIEKRLAS